MDFKKNILKQRHCTICSEGVKLNESNSFLHLSFDKEEKCVIEIKRLSGSALNIIINDIPNILNPNKITKIEVKSKDIIIKRLPKSKGQILISSIKCLNEEKEKSQDEIITMRRNWDSFIKSIGRVKGIKKTDNGVFASEYAELEKANDILDLETDPPNSWIRKKDKIVFTYPCRVFGIQMSGDLPLPGKRAPNFINNIIPQVSDNIIHCQKEKENYQNKLNVQTSQVQKEPSMIFNSSNKLSKYIKNIEKCTIVGNSISMSSIGKFTIPLSLLKENTKYDFFITTRKLNGNGKLGVQLATSDGNVLEGVIIITSNNNKTFKVTFGTKNIKGKSYILSIYRPDKISNGTIIVSDLKIKSNESVSNIKYSSFKDESVVNDLNKNKKCYNNFIDEWYDYTNSKIDSNITKIFKKFSILPSDKFNVSNKIDISGVVALNDFNSKLWYNRVRSFLHKVKYTSDYKILYHNEEISNEKANVSLCSIDCVSSNERIYLSPMPNKHILTQEQLNKLKECKQIITSSFVDLFKIKTLVKDSNVILGNLPLPFVEGKYNTKDYYVYFEEDPSFTRKLINNWDKNKKIYVIGSNLTLPNFAYHKSYLSSYKDLVKYVAESKGLIYLSNNNHHISNLIKLAESCNVAVMTNNHEYLNKHILIRNDNDNLLLDSDVKKSLLNLYSKNNSFNYNESIYSKDVLKDLEIILGGNNA